MDRTKIIFDIIGSPYKESKTDSTYLDNIDDLFYFAFENRVGLLFLEQCEKKNIKLSEFCKDQLQTLRKRKKDTEDVIIKLTLKLNEIGQGKWVLFKTLKPFPSTPNDTDWFPFEIKDHKRFCDHLLNSGFDYLETAPLQTTLIDNSGTGKADSDKRGGVWYIDCYKAPGADYFKYLDPHKLRKYLENKSLNNSLVPSLSDSAELSAICFHNVFPERTYSIESFYLIIFYLTEIQKNEKLNDFISIVKENNLCRAVKANLEVTKILHENFFGNSPEYIEVLLEELSFINVNEKVFLSAQNFSLPYNFSNKIFWFSFFEKLKDPISLRSFFVQLFHMLNPIFFWGVIKIIYKRTSPGSIYKQM